MGVADGEDKNDFLATKACQRSMTKRAISYWMQSRGRPGTEHQFLRRSLQANYDGPNQAEIIVDASPSTSAFWNEVEQVREAVNDGPQAYEPEFILGAWKNIMYIYANSILLGHGSQPMEYPLLGKIYQKRA